MFNGYASFKILFTLYYTLMFTKSCVYVLYCLLCRKMLDWIHQMINSWNISKNYFTEKFSLIYDNWFFWGKIPQLIEKFRISLPPGSPKNLESVTRTFTAPARKVTLHLTPRVPKSWIRGKDSSNKQMDPRQKTKSPYMYPWTQCTMEK